MYASANGYLEALTELLKAGADATAGDIVSYIVGVAVGSLITGTRICVGCH